MRKFLIGLVALAVIGAACGSNDNTRGDGFDGDDRGDIVADGRPNGR